MSNYLNEIIEKYSNIDNIEFSIIDIFFIDFNNFKFNNYKELNHYTDEVQETVEQTLYIYKNININELFTKKILKNENDIDILPVIFNIYLLSEKILLSLSQHINAEFYIKRDIEELFEDFENSCEDLGIKNLIEDMIVFNNTKEIKKSNSSHFTEIVELEYTLMLYCVYIYKRIITELN